MRIRFRSIQMFTAGAVVAGAALFGSTPVAQAQFGQAVAIQELMKPEFLNRDLIIFVEGLDLDSEQQIIIESMFENYRDDFESGLAKLRDSFEAMRSDLNPDDPERVLKMVFAPFEKWRGEREVIRDNFLQNVKLVLSERQLSQWASFEMRLLREKTMDRGLLSGEHMNLFHVLQDMHLDERMMLSIEPILNEYARELDSALKIRNEAINDTQGNMLQALQDSDSTRMLKVVDKQTDLRVSVRNINDHYVQAITAALPNPQSETFYANAMARGYPKIFRRNSAEKLYEAALVHEDLDPDLKSSVRELYENYSAALENIDQRLLDMIRAHEPAAERQHAQAAAARMNNQPYSRMPNPSIVEFRKRDEMVRENVELLRWTVGDEIFMSLPGATRWQRPTRPERTTDNLQTTVGDSKGVPSRGNRSLTAGDDGKSRGSAGGSAAGTDKKKKDPNEPGPPDE